MRCGCISLGDIKCDDCHRVLQHTEPYLVVEETDGMKLRLCVDCCLKRGYARYKVEKGEQVLTFFSE
jgi:sulfur relay (sulfurtransferase) complex TusBCD TusD component (DsrE family)